MGRIQKYRILSIEAEKLVHAERTGGFSALKNNQPNEKLFSGILDYSLESEKLRFACDKTKAMSRKTYFSIRGQDFTTAVVNVKFRYARHDFVSINGIYVREDHAVSDAFQNASEVRIGKDGKPYLVALKCCRALEAPPLEPSLLGDYFVYNDEKNWYERKKSDGKKQNSFAICESTLSLRETLYRDGFTLDGVHYVRYKRSAGSSRVGHCLFIAEPLYDKMMKWTLCGLDMKKRDSVDLASFEAYASLSLSSITDTLSIPKDSILFMKDQKSVFQTHAVSVEADENGRLIPKESTVTVENKIWDGEALLDTSVFKESGYENRGMMLLRNRFFKTCAFHTDLQRYFADNNITEISQLCGYTRARSVSDIRMIVTESSLKYLKLSDKKQFNAKVSAWLDNVDDTFGIVKTDKPTGFFEGKVVRTSYQLLNTLGLSREESERLLKKTLDYYENVRNDPAYMRNYINYILPGNEIEEENTDEIRYFNARQNAILGCLSQNDRFAETTIYKAFRSTVLSSFSKKIRSGKLLVKGTNATIFGNGLELLSAAIGRFREGDAALALAGEGRIMCKQFENGARLLGCRSPHVTMGNLMCAQNEHVPEIDRYFHLTNEIVYVNAIACNIQQRLNGCDYDSDTMLLTDNPIIVDAANKRADFAVPVCSIASTPKQYEASTAGLSALDYEISQNKIGEIINLSQLLNTLYWHNTVNHPEKREENETLYRDICILAVLSGMEIDKAKRNYDVASDSVLAELKAKYPMKLRPAFFKFIMYTLEKRLFEGETKSYDTTMDYIVDITKQFTARASKKRVKKLPLVHFLKMSEDKIYSGSNDAKNCRALKEHLHESQKRISELRITMHEQDADEAYQLEKEIETIYREAIDYVGAKLKNLYMLKSLLRDIDENESGEDSDEDGNSERFYAILFELLCLEKNRRFYKILSQARDTDMYDLVPDEKGEIDIYGIKHSKKYVKMARN